MGRTYAGILGLVAMVVIVARGLRYGAGAEGTLWNASFGLLVFGFFGFVLGSIADATVRDSVRQRVESELAEQEEANPA